MTGMHGYGVWVWLCRLGLVKSFVFVVKTGRDRAIVSLIPEGPSHPKTSNQSHQPINQPHTQPIPRLKCVSDRLVQTKTMNKLAYVTSRLSEPVRVPKTTIGHFEVVDGALIPIQSGISLIGSSHGAAIHLSEEGVSGMHALLDCDAVHGLIFIEDLDSTNGTMLNGYLMKARRMYGSI